MLNPVWLNTFVTLIDTGHFTKTAERLYMTQPGVSQHISKLELACGFSLIRRHNKSFELTEQGLLVYNHAQSLIQNEKELLERLAFDDPFSGICSVACSGALALNLYPKLLELQRKHPELVVKLKASPNQQILYEVQQGIIDIGIVTDTPNENIFEVNQLGQEELCLVLPKHVNTNDEIGLRLNRLGLIEHPDLSHYLPLYFSHCQESSLKNLVISDIPVVGFINQIGQILQPIARGIGFTILPKSAIDSFHDSRLLNVFKPRKTVIEALYGVKKKNRELPERYGTLNSVLHNLMM